VEKFQKIATAILAMPDKSGTIPEIVKSTGIPYSTVYRIVTESHSTSRFFQLHPRGSIFTLTQPELPYDSFNLVNKILMGVTDKPKQNGDPKQRPKLTTRPDELPKLKAEFIDYFTDPRHAEQRLYGLPSYAQSGQGRNRPIVKQYVEACEEIIAYYEAAVAIMTVGMDNWETNNWWLDYED